MLCPGFMWGQVAGSLACLQKIRSMNYQEPILRKSNNNFAIYCRCSSKRHKAFIYSQRLSQSRNLSKSPILSQSRNLSQSLILSESRNLSESSVLYYMQSHGKAPSYLVNRFDSGSRGCRWWRNWSRWGGPAHTTDLRLGSREFFTNPDNCQSTLDIDR